MTSCHFAGYTLILPIESNGTTAPASNIASKITKHFGHVGVAIFVDVNESED